MSKTQCSTSSEKSIASHQRKVTTTLTGIVHQILTLSPVTPLADYYILMGVVYQCPDVMTLINCRLVGSPPLFLLSLLSPNIFLPQLSALNLVKEAFSEGKALSLSFYRLTLCSGIIMEYYILHTAVSYARYDPSKGYYWEFPDEKKTG